MNGKIMQIVPLFKRYNVKKAALFGSMARGEQTQESDMDLIVSFADSTYDLFTIAGLKLDIEDALGIPVDLLTYRSLKDDAFARQVLRDEQVIYEQS